MVFLAWLFFPHFATTDCETWLNEWKVNSINVKVLDKYRSNNHDALMLVTIDDYGKKSEGNWDNYTAMWNVASAGDFLYKSPNTLLVRLKKSDTILTFFPTCNGKTVKD